MKLEKVQGVDEIRLAAQTIEVGLIDNVQSLLQTDRCGIQSSHYCLLCGVP